MGLKLLLELVVEPEYMFTLESIYQKYSKSMFWTAVKILHDYHLAEDAVQQSFLRIINSASFTKNFMLDGNKLHSFLIIVVRNVSYSLHESQDFSLTDDIDEFQEMDVNTPLNIVLSEESLKNMFEAFHQLKPNYRDIALLRFIYDYSDQEIAQLIGISEANVRVRLHRARKKLSNLLRKEGMPHG